MLECSQKQPGFEAASWGPRESMGMAGVDLSQSEADALLAMEKHRADHRRYHIPLAGHETIIPLVSPDQRERFLLDIHRAGINLGKYKYQTRARGVVILARLDLGGGAHRNPDGQRLECSHLHLYREGFADKWAYEVPTGMFRDLSDVNVTMVDFLVYCNVTRPPLIQEALPL